MTWQLQCSMTAPAPLEQVFSFFEDPRGVFIRDLADYSLPLGPLGGIAHALMVKRQLLEETVDAPNHVAVYHPVQSREPNPIQMEANRIPELRFELS
jgi:hypothetical protein